MDFSVLPDILKLYILFLAFCVGAVFASALMCLCWRMTHNEKWMSGRSRCDYCGHELGWRDLVPIFSWMFAKGKCRYCGEKIGKSVIAGEVFLAFVTMLLPIRFGISLDTIKYLIFIYLLFCMALCDLYSFEIPDRFWVIGSVVFVLLLFVDKDWKQTLLQGLIGGFVIALLVLLLSLVMARVLGKETMGMGDIKLLFMTGLYLGFWGNLLMLIVSCIVGLVLSKVLTENAAEDDEVPEGAFPFGPAISLSAMLCVFVGEPLIRLYLSLF